MIYVRTRLRQVRIGARTFVWRAEIRHVQGSGDCHRCIRLRVWGAGKTSQALPDFLLTDRLRTPESADPTVRVIRAYERRQGT